MNKRLKTPALLLLMLVMCGVAYAAATKKQAKAPGWQTVTSPPGRACWCKEEEKKDDGSSYVPPQYIIEAHFVTEEMYVGGFIRFGRPGFRPSANGSGEFTRDREGNSHGVVRSGGTARRPLNGSSPVSLHIGSGTTSVPVYPQTATKDIPNCSDEGADCSP